MVDQRPQEVENCLDMLRHFAILECAVAYQWRGAVSACGLRADSVMVTSGDDTTPPPLFFFLEERSKGGGVGQSCVAFLSQLTVSSIHCETPPRPPLARPSPGLWACVCGCFYLFCCSLWRFSCNGGALSVPVERLR